MSWAPCCWAYNIVFSCVYHVSIFSVTCIYMFISCFASRCLISSDRTIGSRMDPSGLTRGPSSLLDTSMWDLNMLFQQSIWLGPVDAIINSSGRRMDSLISRLYVRQHDVLLATLVLRKTYWSSFILSNIWSLPDLSLPLPVTLPRTVSLHIRGRGRRVGAERCTKRKMKFPGHIMEWGVWWAWRRECLLFISFSKANSLKKG